MQDGLYQVPWAEIEPTMGQLPTCPDLLPQMLDPDPKVRSETLHALYGNVLHKGTHFPAACSEVPETYIDLPRWCRFGKIG